MAEVKRNLMEDRPAPTGRSYYSPFGPLHSQAIFSLSIPISSLVPFLAVLIFFLSTIFSPLQFIHSPYSPYLSFYTLPSLFPLAPLSAACKLSSSLSSSPLCQSVIFLPLLSFPRSLLPSISLPHFAYLPRACIVI